MKIIDEPLLDEFRSNRHCEYCMASTPRGADPHHVFAHGQGSAFRLDVRGNLVALCRP